MNFSKLFASQEALEKLSKQDLPIREAIAVSRLIKKCSAEYEFFNEQRLKLIEKYCTIDGDQYQVKPECMKVFNEQLTELLNTELEAEIEPVEITADIQLSGNDIIALEGFIKFEE